MKALKYIIFMAEYVMIGILYFGLDFLSEKTKLWIWLVYAIVMLAKGTIILKF